MPSATTGGTVVVEFLRAYPDVRMRVQLSERIVNLLEEHIDLAMRVGELPDSSMIAKRVGLIRQVLCASPAYLKARGEPKKPADEASNETPASEDDITEHMEKLGEQREGDTRPPIYEAHAS